MFFGPGPGDLVNNGKVNFILKIFSIAEDTSLHDTLTKIGIKLLNNNSLSKFFI